MAFYVNKPQACLGLVSGIQVRELNIHTSEGGDKSDATVLMKRAKGLRFMLSEYNVRVALLFQQP